MPSRSLNVRSSLTSVSSAGLDRWANMSTASTQSFREPLPEPDTLDGGLKEVAALESTKAPAVGAGPLMIPSTVSASHRSLSKNKNQVPEGTQSGNSRELTSSEDEKFSLRKNPAAWLNTTERNYVVGESLNDTASARLAKAHQIVNSEEIPKDPFHQHLYTKNNVGVVAPPSSQGRSRASASSKVPSSSKGPLHYPTTVSTGFGVHSDQNADVGVVDSVVVLEKTTSQDEQMIIPSSAAGTLNREASLPGHTSPAVGPKICTAPPPNVQVAVRPKNETATALTTAVADVPDSSVTQDPSAASTTGATAAATKSPPLSRDVNFYLNHQSLSGSTAFLSASTLRSTNSGSTAASTAQAAMRRRIQMKSVSGKRNQYEQGKLAMKDYNYNPGGAGAAGSASTSGSAGSGRGHLPLRNPNGGGLGQLLVGSQQQQFYQKKGNSALTHQHGPQPALLADMAKAAAAAKQEKKNSTSTTNCSATGTTTAATATSSSFKMSQVDSNTAAPSAAPQSYSAGSSSPANAQAMSSSSTGVNHMPEITKPVPRIKEGEPIPTAYVPGPNGDLIPVYASMEEVERAKQKKGTSKEPSSSGEEGGRGGKNNKKNPAPVTTSSSLESARTSLEDSVEEVKQHKGDSSSHHASSNHHNNRGNKKNGAKHQQQGGGNNNKGAGASGGKHHQQKYMQQHQKQNFYNAPPTASPTHAPAPGKNQDELMMQQQQQQLLLQQQYAAALVVSQQYAAARAAHAAAAMAAAATGPSYYDPATDDPMMYHHHAAATHGYGSYDHPTAVGVGGPSYDGAGYDDSPQHDALVHHPLGGGGPAYENIKVPKAVTFGDLPPSSLDGEGKAGGAAVSGGRGGSSSASRNRGKNNNLISRLPPGLEVVFEESESCSGRSSSSAATTSGSPADRGAATNALPSPTHNIIPDEQHQSALQGNVTSSPPTTNMRLPPELPSCLTQLKNRQR